MTKKNIESKFQTELDRLTDMLSKAITNGNIEHEKAIRAMIFEVETLASGLGVNLVNNFDPLA